ncbi:MAG: hypothetical protein EBR81_06770 [Proteobacteria bacterium]|nr:hypothetical protein [Pseudomonadota bacterium]
MGILSRLSKKPARILKALISKRLHPTQQKGPAIRRNKFQRVLGQSHLDNATLFLKKSQHHRSFPLFVPEHRKLLPLWRTQKRLPLQLQRLFTCQADQVSRGVKNLSLSILRRSLCVHHQHNDAAQERRHS